MMGSTCFCCFRFHWRSVVYHLFWHDLFLFLLLVCLGLVFRESSVLTNGIEAKFFTFSRVLILSNSWFISISSATFFIESRLFSTNSLFRFSIVFIKNLVFNYVTSLLKFCYIFSLFDSRLSF